MARDLFFLTCLASMLTSAWAAQLRVENTNSGAPAFEL
jgi:hypothetical protein